MIRREHAAGALLMMLVGQMAFAVEVTVERSDRGALVRADGELFAEYLTLSGHQPAVWPIIGPTGQPMTRSYPAGPKLPGEMDDHPHHHSLWFTHGDVNGIDFWTNTKQSGQDVVIQHREFVDLANHDSSARIVTRNDWLHDGKRVCEDERTLVFGVGESETPSEPGRPRPRPSRWIDFTVTIKATDGELNFGDTKEGSFAIRAAGPLTVDTADNAHLVNNRGQSGGETWGMHASWIDDFGPVEGEVVGIAMFDHPDNVHHPTRWHARTYGLLAANPFGEHHFPRDPEGPPQGVVTIAAGEELTLRYRVLFHKGDTKQAAVAEAYQAFAGDSGRGAE